MEMVNGYVFLDLTKANVYSKALKVLGTDKPVVIKDGSGSPYFVDSLTLDGTNVVITKGGKTITIANDNTITNVGDIQVTKLTLYRHNIRCEYNGSQSSAHVTMELISESDTVFVKDGSTNSLAKYLYDNGYNTKDKAIMATGTYYLNSEAVERPVLCLFASSATNLKVYDVKPSDNTEYEGDIGGTGANFGLYDFVTPII